MDNLIYEDNPTVSIPSYYGGSWTKAYFYSWLKALVYGIQMWPIFLALMVLLILVLFHIRQEDMLQIVVLVFVLINGFVALSTIPTKHQIFSDKIRIILGWIFHFDIPFSKIKNIEEATLYDLWGLRLNFIPPFSGTDVVQIERKRGLKINIIPGNRTLFLENLNKALDDWRRINPG
jgi:hypothetical protein